MGCIKWRMVNINENNFFFFFFFFFFNNNILYLINNRCSLTYECLNKINKCWAEAYGYSCCSECVSVLDKSYNKKWGIENGRW